MSKRIRAAAGVSAIAAGLLTLVSALILAGNVYVWLKDYLGDSAPGVPYAVGFSVAGAVVAALIFYSAYMLFSSWSTRRFLTLVQVAVVVCAICAVASSVWFIVVSGLFGFPGVVGLAVTFTVGFSLVVIAQIIKDEDKARP